MDKGFSGALLLMFGNAPFSATVEAIEQVVGKTLGYGDDSREWQEQQMKDICRCVDRLDSFIVTREVELTSFGRRLERFIAKKIIKATAELN